MPDEVQSSQHGQPKPAEGGGGETPVESLGEAGRSELLARVTQFFSGPLPPPMILQAYDRLVPGAAKEMHEPALARARHHMDMDRKALDAQAQDQQAARTQFRRGQNYAFVLSLFLIACGTAIIVLGHDEAGAGIIVANLVGLVLAFIWGRKPGASSRQEQEDRTRNSPRQV
ncbi:MAG: DUF2335 domain-containing protein [Planctomycetes bacterium]|nr:DUF2335 domain-containing protein [Planctomycetota bacterium]